MLRFSWSQAKARANLRKHGVEFEEARTVFHDENAIQFYDEDHSFGEDRFIMLGMSHRLRILVVVHSETSRGEIIRLISARKATAKEQAHYRGRAI